MENTKVYTYDVLGNKYEVLKDELTLSVHIYGIAIDNGKILISPQYNGYDFPGGTVEKGETHIDTLIREFKEETGYTIKPTELLDVYTSFFHHQKENADYQCYLIYYLVKVVDGKISNEGFDDDEKEYAQTAKWVDINTLKTMKHTNSLSIGDKLIENVINKNLNL